MPWRYTQATGELHNPQGDLVATGYSGHGEGVNNPAMERVECVGPIPRGEWMVGQAYQHARLGPVTMNLAMMSGDAFGRTLFRIHGDTGRGDRSASEGCIILPRSVRVAIDASDDGVLVVG